MEQQQQMPKADEKFINEYITQLANQCANLTVEKSMLMAQLNLLKKELDEYKAAENLPK